MNNTRRLIKTECLMMLETLRRDFLLFVQEGRFSDADDTYKKYREVAETLKKIEEKECENKTS